MGNENEFAGGRELTELSRVVFEEVRRVLEDDSVYVQREACRQTLRHDPETSPARRAVAKILLADSENRNVHLGVNEAGALAAMLRNGAGL